MQTAVTDAQFDASVGNVKSGFFRRCVAPFRRIRRTAAADCKDHVRLADLRDPRQRLCIFKSRVIPVLEAAEKLDLPFDRLADQRLRCRSRLLTAHNDRRLAIV